MAIRNKALINSKWFAKVGMLTMLSSNVYALGLGNLEVLSNLDQPLNATIELLVDKGDSLNEVEAKIASKEDFEELGIEYPGYLSNIRLSLQSEGSKQVLKVDSKGVVIKEPFIHFLVRVDWSGGSFLREYTALIDPPVYAADAPRNISSPRIVGVDQASSVVTEQPMSSEVLTEESFSTVSDAASNGQITDAQYGPITTGETLSAIASSLQQQFPDLSIYQIMQVLFNENQEAFIDSNINGLIKGSVLKVADINQIRAVDVEESKRFFREHVERWAVNKPASDGSSDSLKVAQDEYEYQDESSFEDAFSSDEKNDNEFQVGAGTNVDATASDSDSVNRQGEVLALQTQITELESSLKSSELENQELKERISILEGQLTDMNRLVSLDVKDAELANLESSLAEQNATQDEEVISDTLIDDLVGDTTEEVESTGSELVDELAIGDETDIESVEGDVLDSELAEEDSVIEEVVDDSTEILDDVTEEVAAAENTAVATPVVQMPQKSFLDKVISFFTDGIWGGVLAALGAAILGILGLVFYRKRQADEEFEVSMLSIETQSGGTLRSENSTGYASIDSLSDHPVTEMSKTLNSDSEIEEEGAEAAGGNVDEPTKETSFLTVYSDSDAVVQADEVDPIAEADVYIAYGRDEQAEEVLKDGISSNPDRPDIKHKLLGLYHKNDNKEEFERLAEELYADKDKLEPTMWREIAEMGKQILPASPLFELSEEDLQAAEEAAVVDAAESSLEDPVESNTDDDIEAMFESTEDGLIDIASEPIDEDSTDADESSDLLDDDSLNFDSVDLEETSEVNLTNFEEKQNEELSALDQVELDGVDMAQDDTLSLDEIDDSSADSVEIDLDDEEELIDFDSIEADSHAISVHEVEDVNELDEEDVEEEKSDSSFSSDVSDLEIGDDHDEARTQYELAKVFVDLGDVDGATKILNEIVGNTDNDPALITEANELLESIKA